MTDTALDRPAAVRPGEELDLERLGPYLKEMLGLDGTLEVLQYPSGYSNLTYMIRIGDTGLVLRRPPFGTKPRTGHDMQREHTVLDALHGNFRYAPRPLLYCEDSSVIGGPFYLMERIEGIIIRRQLPAGLRLAPEDVGRLFRRVVDVHVELHAVDHRAIGLGDFGKPEGYVERQLQGWSDRYRRARTPDVPDCEEIMAWLARAMPADSGRGCIVHNDFRLDNVVLDAEDPLRIIGVLDWEMATIGDPLMDLGASLAYWVERDDPPALQPMAMMPTNVDGAPTRAEVVSHYAERSGLEIGDFDFYLCFGLFRLAVIAQQIYYRFHHGQTEDPRFRHLNMWISALALRAGAVIEGSRRGF